MIFFHHKHLPILGAQQRPLWLVLATLLSWVVAVPRAVSSPPGAYGATSVSTNVASTGKANDATDVDERLFPASSVKVWATIYDPDTIAAWNATGYVPAFLEGVEVDDVPLDEAVFDLDVVAPDAAGQWYHLTARVRGSDGAIAVVSMQPVVVPTDPLVVDPLAGLATRGCNGGPWWRRGRICCFTQYLICSTVHQLFPAYCSQCNDCFWDCIDCNVDDPCHSCGNCGGSQILCYWFGYC